MASAKGYERRQERRENLRLPLLLSMEQTVQRNWTPASVLDVSPGGLLVSLPEHWNLHPDEPVKLRFPFSETSGYELGPGIIRHIKSSKDAEILGIGLQEKTPFFSRVAMLGVSPQILEIKALLPQIGASGLNILIRGETGTGKNILAKLIHELRRGEERPFIRVNCPSIPESLFESELFGHEKGAYTDAKSSSPGFFRLAGDGTILLDEISEIQPHLQAKLLSVIEEKQFIPVGGQKPVPVRANIIATTNLDLEKAVAEGRFRRDLFYRLSEMPIYLPPLAERKEDVPLLANHFLFSYCEKYQRPFKTLSPSELDLLKGHSWPGNIRELENYLKQTALLGHFVGPSPADLGHVMKEQLDNGGMADFLVGLIEENLSLPELTKKMTEELERMMIYKTLETCRQNRTNAANQLGISYRTLLRKLEQFHSPPSPSNSL